MVRMNTLISSKKGEQHQLEQGNVLIEKEFVHSLKASYTHDSMTFTVLIYNVHVRTYMYKYTCMYIVCL